MAETTTGEVVTIGQEATFTVSASGGIGPYTYQWYEGSTLLEGETRPSLTVSKDVAGIYTYYCKITDSTGAVTNSNPMTLTVKAADAGFPTIYLIAIVAAVALLIVAWLLIKFLKRPKKLPTPAQLRITAEPTTLVADGETTATITIQLLDKEGNPMPALVDTQVKVKAEKGKVENPVVTIPKGKYAEQTILVSPVEAGVVPVSAMAEGLKSITVTLNFVERARYCMHCGTQMVGKARACKNCGLLPPAGVDTKVCGNCDSVIPIVAKFCGECGAGQKE
jgi:hypothetical protein